MTEDASLSNAKMSSLGLGMQPAEASRAAPFAVDAQQHAQQVKAVPCTTHQSDFRQPA